MKGKSSARRTLPFWCCLFGVPVCTQILPGVRAEALSGALIAGALLGAVYLIVRPLLRLLSMPVGCLTLGLSNFAIDCALFYLLPRFIPGFYVAGLEWAALGALLISGVCAITNALN